MRYSWADDPSAGEHAAGILVAYEDDRWHRVADADWSGDFLHAVCHRRQAIDAAERQPLERVTLRPMFSVWQRVFCIGLNYRDHATETNSPIPSEPIVFAKMGTTLTGPGEPVRLPRVSDRVDFEAELVVLIGDGAAADPMDRVAGYCCGNDVSARDWQKGKPGRQWMMGKSFDTFAPHGPYLATADEVADPQSLRVRCRVGGETMQDGSTAEMIFGVREIIEYLSSSIGLQYGDLIFTGTPAGVGDARTPPRYLRPGETVEVEIDGLGVLSNPVVADD